MDRLKPCGCEHSIRIVRDKEGWYCMCNSCLNVSHRCDTERAAIEDWNTGRELLEVAELRLKVEALSQAVEENWKKDSPDGWDYCRYCLADQRTPQESHKPDCVIHVARGTQTGETDG